MKNIFNKVLELKISDTPYNNSDINARLREIGAPSIEPFQSRTEIVRDELTGRLTLYKAAKFEEAYTTWDADHTYLYISYTTSIAEVLKTIDELVAKNVIKRYQKGCINISAKFVAK